MHYAGRYEEALSAYEQLLKHNKKGELTPPWTHLDFTAAYLKLGREDEARTHFAEVIKLYSNFSFVAWARVQLGYKSKHFPHWRRLFEPLRSMYGETPEKKRYLHTGAPAFQLEYPEGSEKLAFDYPNQVFRIRHPGSGLIQACVADTPRGMTLAEVDQKPICPRLRSKDHLSVLSLMKKSRSTTVRKPIERKLNDYIST